MDSHAESEDGDDNGEDEAEEDDEGNGIEDNFQHGVIVDDDVNISSINVNPGVGDFLLLCRNLIVLINGSAVLFILLAAFVF
jgi:hypothetical protein